MKDEWMLILFMIAVLLLAFVVAPEPHNFWGTSR